MSDQVEILSCLCGGQPKRVAVNLDERFAYAQEVTYQCRECHHRVTVRGDTSKPGYADNTGIEDRAIAAWNAYASIQTEKIADMQRRLDEFSAVFGPMIDYIRAEVFVPLGASLTHTLLEDHKRLKEDAHKDGLLRVQYAQRIEELRQRVVDATRHERHRTKDESRYWCDQYKQIAHGFVSVLEGK